MKLTKDFLLTGAFLMGVTAGSAQATSISYTMDQSNVLADGVDYLSVTISDSISTDDIYFTVNVLTANFPPQGDNFGMDRFSFNFDASLTVTAANIVAIDPNSWVIATDKNAGGGFGFFDFRLAGPGARTETLTFTITGVDGDSIYDYAVGYNGIGLEPYFAAHVGGFYDAATGETSGHFGTVVPVPAAVWLFGSGLLGLVGIARRRV